MIIIFELPLSILVRQNRTTLQTAVSCLLAVHRTGKNLTIFERNSAEWLCQNIPLIEQDLAALRRIQQQYTQLGNLVNVASCCIKIEPEGTLFSSNSQGTKVHLPIDYCKFYEIIQAPLLIVEDVDSDRLVFDFVFKNYPRNHHNIYYEVCHGGGEAAIRVAKAKVSEDRIVVLIADSDRSSPLSPNTKFERFRKEKEQIGWPLLFIHVLPVHEIENIFGLSVYERVGRIKLTESFQIIQSIRIKEKDNNVPVLELFQWFFDMKEGIKSEKIGLISDQNVKGWLTGRLALAEGLPENYEISGFGSRIVQEVLSAGECLSEFRNVIRSQEWLSVFGDFFQDIIWLLMAAPRQYT